MLYFATFDFENVTIHGHEVVSVIPGTEVIAFGTDYDLIKLAAETYAAQHNLIVLDNVRHVAYSPPLLQEEEDSGYDLQSRDYDAKYGVDATDVSPSRRSD